MPYHQFTIRLPDRLHAPIIRLLMNRGCLGTIEQPDALVAYFPFTTDPQHIIVELGIWKSLIESQEPGFSLSYEHGILPDADWNESWKKGFQPVDIGSRFTIAPPWNVVQGKRLSLIIDPGMAFGTGHHETTKSCLILIERHSEAVNKRRFLDVGTGTGLLAIAALKLGFHAVVGIDTDPLAIEAARRNLTFNQAEKILLREGTLEAAPGHFDMIAANLISGTIIDIADALAGRLEPGGIVILSGILHGQQDDVAASMRSAGLSLIEQLRDGKWVSLALKR